MLQEGQLSSTAVYKAEIDLTRESRQNSSEAKEDARDPDPDPDPDVQAQQDFWSIMGDYVYRNHVAPRTKLHVPHDDFPIPLNYMDVQRQTKISFDVPHEDDWNIDGHKSLSETWIGVPRFELHNKKNHQKDICGFKAE